MKQTFMSQKSVTVLMKLNVEVFHEAFTDVIALSNGIIDIRVLTYGATLIHFGFVNEPNCVVRYQDLDLYESNPVYLGSVVGPTAGRIKDGHLCVDKKEYALSINNHPNHLHGGYQSHAFKTFSYTIIEDGIRFELEDTPHDGYTLTFKTTVTYQLQDAQLIVTTSALPSEPFPVNITTHNYFNLDGSNSLANHSLKVEANEIYTVDASLANDGVTLNVAHTAFDFRAWKSIEEALTQKHPEFKKTRFIDHDYRLDGKLYLKTQTRMLVCETSLPVLRLYFANYFDETFKQEHGEDAHNFSALAIEPQFPANAINFGQGDIFSADTPYTSRSSYTLYRL